jgi:hypothetical protein
MKSGIDLKSGARKRSCTPFTTLTSSSKLPASPQLHNSDSPRPQLNDERLAPRPAATRREQAMQAQLSKKLRADTALPLPGREETYLNLLDRRCPASSENSNDGRKLLQSV